MSLTGNLSLAGKTRIAAAVALGTVVAGGATAAFASTAARTPAGGTIHVYVSTGGRSSTVAPILVAGAIGDYGRAISIDKNGTVDAKGTYVKVVLRKGTFEVNATPFDTNLARVVPSFDKATCSEYLSGSGQATLYKGTGLYAGVGGRAHLTETVAAITSRRADGTCDTRRSAQPVSEYSFITGTGTVTF